MEEIWKIVGGFPNYMISSHGRVKSLNFNKTKQERILKPNNALGYLQVQLYARPINVCIKVHRLVALGFIPNHENKPHINHIDGNKENNHVSNLEWVTCRENIQHAYSTGLRKGGEGHHLSKLTIEQVNEIRKLRGKVYQKEIAKMFGIKQPQVSAIQLNQSWKTSP